ncbi:MAG: hypothetical protein ACF8LL_13000, partial [Phycisphaerales bacterium]
MNNEASIISRYDKRDPLTLFQRVVLQPALYTAIRSGLIGINAFPLPSVLRFGRTLGRTYGGLGVTRKRVV